MTVQTPFPDRPATPFWSPYGVWSSGRSGSGMGEVDPSSVVGNVTGDISDVFRVLYSNQPGMYTAQMADGSIVTYRQPEGSTGNLLVGNIQGAGSLQASPGGIGVWGLVAIGALVLFMSRGKR